MSLDIIKLLNKNNIPYQKDVSGAKLSYFGSGGNIGCLIEPRSIEEVLLAKQILGTTQYYLIAGGSNTLIADKGISVALSLNKLKGISVKDNIIECYAGCKLQSLVSLAKKCSLSGAEFLTGIPGTFGGAVFMNAGAFGMEIKDVLHSITLIEDNRLVEYRPEELNMQYRKGNIGERTVISGKVKLYRDNQEKINALIKKYKDYRINTQPQERSLGSVFKRVNGLSAAIYIERTGLKGMTIGGAELSAKHCNFIINKGGATSADYLKIVNTVQKAVGELGINLELENVLLI